jgi:hypothetical protein
MNWNQTSCEQGDFLRKNGSVERGHHEFQSMILYHIVRNFFNHGTRPERAGNNRSNENSLDS